MKLYMLLVGCKPAGRHIEQHDMFFAVGETLKDIIPGLLDFWPEANGKIHIDAWREVTQVDGFKVEVVDIDAEVSASESMFFMNLGGYKVNEFDELHYKMLVIEQDKAVAIKRAKESAFYQHTGFQGAPSHIDDKYGVDVDDVFEIEDVLSPEIKAKYKLHFTAAEAVYEDEIHLGYLPLKNL